MRRRPVIAASVACFALAGCGSSSSKTSTSHPSTPTSTASTSGTSKPAFIARADAICQGGKAAFAPLSKLSSASSNTAVQQAFQNAEGPFAALIRRLERLTPPPELAAAWNRYMSDVKQEAPYISRMATAAGAGDAGAFTKDAGQAEQIVKDARQALVGQGFAHCGQGH